MNEKKIDNRIKTVDEIPDVLTMPIVSRVLGCALNTAYGLLKRSDFPCYVIGNRVYVEKKKFLAWLNRQTAERR